MWKPGNFVYPIPAVLVTCGDEKKANVMTVAWTGTLNSSPAIAYISVRKERYSYNIIKENKEFVINLTNEKLAYATDWCGVRSGAKYDKFKEMHLTPQESKKVSCPGILESPVNIECKVNQILELGSHDMIVADVLCVTVDDKYMDDKGRFDLQATDLVAYSHGEYFELGDKLGKFGYSVAKKPTGKAGKKTPVGKKKNKKR